jgi:hypothetical protein
MCQAGIATPIGTPADSKLKILKRFTKWEIWCPPVMDTMNWPKYKGAFQALHGRLAA